MEPREITESVRSQVIPLLTQMMKDLGFERGQTSDKTGFYIETLVGGELWSKAFGEYSEVMWQYSKALDLIPRVSARAYQGPCCVAMHPFLKASLKIRNNDSVEFVSLSCFIYRDSKSSSIRVTESLSTEGATHGTECNPLSCLTIDLGYDAFVFDKALRSGDPTLLVGLTLRGWPTSKSFDRWTITEASFSDI